MSEGIWTMTDTEFNRELAKAWDEGADSEFKRSVLKQQRDPNPYRSGE